MSDDRSTSALFLSRGIAPTIVLIGTWLLLLAFIDLIWGVVRRGDGALRANWPHLLSFGNIGDGYYVDASIGFGVSHHIFTAIACLILFWGLMAIAKLVDGGVLVWAKGLANHAVWGGLTGPTKASGWKASAACWCILIGFSFYFGWSAIYWTWIDVGVYSVSIILIGFGLSLAHLVSLEETENIS